MGHVERRREPFHFEGGQGIKPEQQDHKSPGAVLNRLAGTRAGMAASADNAEAVYLPAQIRYLNEVRYDQ